MAEISRLSLFGKLNSLGYRSMEAATTFCKLRGNPYVELVHWFHQILQLTDSDLHRIIKHFDLDESRVASGLMSSLDELPRGATSISDLSSQVEDAIERGWLYGSLVYNSSQVRTGHVVVGMLKTRQLRNSLVQMCHEFGKIGVEPLTDDFQDILGESPEAAMTPTDGSQVGGGAGASPGEVSGAMTPAQMGGREALQQFTTDLTEQARCGEIDPIVGRDNEIRQIADILMRRRQNNPILTGEAGVGKTAVVEGFALRLVAKDVPPPLQGVSLLTLDIGLLQAGASMKGEFENRLRQVIDEVQSSESPIILFIDEAHTLIGAGGAAGTGDAANLLKPALARGTLRTIAATTWAEYKKHIEKDPALTRRFQVVQIDEPSEDRALLMMRAIASTQEKHHRVQVLDEALEASVKLSHRYIPARQLPDKSVSLLDTACARVAISQHSVPAAVDDRRRQIQALETELEIIDRERATGIDIGTREDEAQEKRGAVRGELDELEARWGREKEVVEQILSLRADLRGSDRAIEGTDSELEERAAEVKEQEDDSSDGAAVTDEDRERRLDELREALAELAEIQGEAPLILPSVDAQAVATVVGEWTGIPVGRMVRNEIQTVLSLADLLNERVVGQRHALDAIAKRIETSRASFDNPNKPIGVFLLAGPSGVGKTETAIALAETLYGGSHNVITINMSEFQEKHTVSTLKGAPPGYVGYGEGGVLTEAVRRKPYSVVLLDEVEKAHSDVHELFFQVFDKGIMEDGEGRRIDFKNTLILLTSNVGSDLIMNMCKDPELKPAPDGLAKALREPLLKIFPAALLGRLVVIPYYPLDDETIALIARLQLDRIRKRIAKTRGIPFSYSEEAVELIVARCTEVESGGRMIDSILTNTVLPRISREFLERSLAGGEVQRIAVDVDGDQFSYTVE